MKPHVRQPQCVNFAECYHLLSNFVAVQLLTTDIYIIYTTTKTDCLFSVTRTRALLSSMVQTTHLHHLQLVVNYCD